MNHHSFKVIVVSGFGIIAIECRKSKEIDLYSDCTENKLQALTFAAVTSALGFRPLQLNLLFLGPDRPYIFQHKIIMLIT